MKLFLTAFMGFSILLFSNNLSAVDKEKISEAFGHFIGRNLNGDAYSFDLEKVILGIRNGFAGQPAPMSEEEYQTAMTQLQEEAMEKIGKENKEKAETFLAQIAKDPNVHAIVPHKLYYKLVQAGEGEAITASSTPLLHFEGKLLDGTVFGSSAEAGGPVQIPLASTVEGFSKGLQGMQEGEKRILYIHPDLGYGDSGILPPNSLLIFEVEVVQAHAPQKDESK